MGPTGQIMSDIFWPICGVLRHVKVHFVQHVILSACSGGGGFVVCNHVKSELYDISYLLIYFFTRKFMRAFPHFLPNEA